MNVLLRRKVNKFSMFIYSLTVISIAMYTVAEEDQACFFFF